MLSVSTLAYQGTVSALEHLGGTVAVLPMRRCSSVYFLSLKLTHACMLMTGVFCMLYVLEKLVFRMRCVARQPGASTTLKPTSTVKRAIYDALLD